MLWTQSMSPPVRGWRVHTQTHTYTQRERERERGGGEERGGRERERERERERVAWERGNGVDMFLMPGARPRIIVIW